MGGLQQIHVPSSSLMTKQSEEPEQRLFTNGASSCQRGLFPTSGPPAQGEDKFLISYFQCFALIWFPLIVDCTSHQ